MDLQLRRLRVEAGLSQTQLAEKVGVSLKTVGNWERGETAITLEDAYNCAVALDCTPNDLCGWPEGKNEGRSFPDPFELELVDCYRSSTSQRKASVLQTARDAAAMSKYGSERLVPEAEGVSRGKALDWQVVDGMGA